MPRAVRSSKPERIAKDLIAASATALVLSILNKGDSYGYAIIQEVRELSGGQLEWSEGMLYPVLHRMEDQGLIESFEERGDNGRSASTTGCAPTAAARSRRSAGSGTSCTRP